VFLGPSLGVVVMVAGAGADATLVAQRVRVAAAVAQRAPFVRPDPGEPHPVTTDDGIVSVWEYVPTVPWRDLEAVGTSVAAFHAVDGTMLATGTALGPARVMADTTRWIDALAERRRLRPADAKVLRVVDRRLLDALGPPDPTARGLLHGDLYWPNVLLTRQGAVLCDTDELGLGSPAYDVAHLLDPDRDHLTVADVDAFASGYGAPVPDSATRRFLVQRSHLTFTLRLADRVPSSRGRYWVDQWMAGWRRVAAGGGPLTPPRERSRLAQLGVVVGGPFARAGGGARGPY
jgi:hypothetical protein